MMRPCLAMLALTVLSAPCEGAWYRASSEHFVIYADQDPGTLRHFAENLEKFDGAVRAVRKMGDLPLSSGNRLTIFSLRDVKDVQRLAGDSSGFIAGFYRGQASGSVAYIPRVTILAKGHLSPTGSHLSGDFDSPPEMSGTVVLLHEYSHHLMMQDLDRPYPEWLVEGFAEFMSTAQFESDGSVGLGLPAGHRYGGLEYGAQLPLQTLLAGRYDKISAEERESIYGKGWLLTHYLTFEPSRKGQLGAYVTALTKGTDALDAARQAFGDLGKLDRDLIDYLHRSQLQYLKVSGAALNFAPVEVTKLSAGGAAIAPLLAEVRNGAKPGQAEAVAARARAIEARFAGDELIETTLAEAELNAAHAESAEAAANRALAANPRSSDAMILKGRSLGLQAMAAKGVAAHALFDQAQKIFIAANKIDQDDPEPLYEFYKTFVEERVRPSANAVAALHYASDLAPQDSEVRMASAIQYLIDGQPAPARKALLPVAYNPHETEVGPIARKVIERIDAGDTKGAIAAAEVKSAN